jgi:hypothetical protein
LDLEIQAYAIPVVWKGEWRGAVHSSTKFHNSFHAGVGISTPTYQELHAAANFSDIATEILIAH